VLVRVIENDDINAERNGLSNSPNAVGRDDHRYSGVQSLVHHHLVGTVSAEYDGRRSSPVEKLSRDPRGDWRFAGTANRQITDTENG
jgi:hypothetical protein